MSATNVQPLLCELRDEGPRVFGFCVLGPPVPKGRPRLGKNGRTFTPKRTREYEKLVRSVAALRVPPGWDATAQMRVLLKFYMPTKRKVDGDNLQKAVLDAMNRTVYRDDSQVVSAKWDKYADRERPRVEVEVWRV